MSCHPCNDDDCQKCHHAWPSVRDMAARLAIAEHERGQEAALACDLKNAVDNLSGRQADALKREDDLCRLNDEMHAELDQLRTALADLQASHDALLDLADKQWYGPDSSAYHELKKELATATERAAHAEGQRDSARTTYDELQHEVHELRERAEKAEGQAAEQDEYLHDCNAMLAACGCRVAQGPIDGIAKLIDQRDDARAAIAQFAQLILHGDAEHRAWLAEAAEQFGRDGTVPPPRGLGRAEAAEVQLEQLRAEVARLTELLASVTYERDALRGDGHSLAAQLEQVRGELAEARAAEEERKVGPRQGHIPDADSATCNLKDRPHLMLEGYRIAEWHPEKDGAGKPTQVHLVMDIPEIGASIAVRFKSADAIDRHVAVMLRHRASVFGGDAG